MEVPRINNCRCRGKTVQRLTKEEGEANRSPVETTIPLDFVPVRFRRGNNLKGLKSLDTKTKARIWP